MESLKEVSALIRSGDLMPTDYVRTVFRKIRARSADDHIFITMTEDLAMEQAEQAEKQLKEKGAGSRLLGIPFTLKDVFYTKGIRTTGGSKVRADAVPALNAEVVDRLYGQGAVLLGKVNLHEFAYGATGQNAYFGTVANPYDKTRLAGGSSSGSAAAVASGYGLFSLGTDTGGSARVPAALCGICGFKPTRDLLSCKGVIPLSWSLDHVGILANTAEDIRIVLEELAGLPVQKDPAGPAQEASSGTALKGLRIGIPDSFFYEDLDPEIEAAMERVKAEFVSLGGELVRVSLPDLTDSRTASLVIQLPEILSYHGKALAEKSGDFAADMLAGMAAGQFIPAEQYILAKRTLNYYKTAINELFRDIDVFLLPSTPCTAPRIDDEFVEIGGAKVPVGNAVTRFFSLFNMTGNPSLTSPAGFSSEGLPIGYQLVGRLHEDQRVLRISQSHAEACR